MDDSLYDVKASPQLASTFERRATKVVCSDGQVLFNSGEPGRCVYLVLAGEIRLFLPLNSEDAMGFRAQAGAFVGMPAAFSHEPYSMSAITGNGAVVAVMSRDKFCDLVAADPMLAFDVLKILAAETRAARIAIVEAEVGRRSRRLN